MIDKKDLIPDGGMISIFHRIGCIGDSLSSGEFEYDENGEKGFWDYYEYSWGKCIERATGVSVVNFSRGGLTAKDFYTQAVEGTCTKEEVNHVFEPEYLQQAYIVALGVNDIKGPGYAREDYTAGLGDPEKDVCLVDYEKNADSIMGWYAKIIQRLQTLQPDAKFFLMGIPNDTRRVGVPEFNAGIVKLCELLPNCYYLDFYNDAPVYDAPFRARYFDGHMNAMGYQLTARYVMTMIDRIIDEKWQDFVYVQFIGTGKKPFSGNRVVVENIQEC